MRKYLLLFTLMYTSASFAQLENPKSKHAWNSLYQSSNGTSWTISSLEELSKRNKPPFVLIEKNDQSWFISEKDLKFKGMKSLSKIDLSNNNLSGTIEDDFWYSTTVKLDDGTDHTSTDPALLGFSNLVEFIFEHNNLTSINGENKFVGFERKVYPKGVNLGNNKLTRISFKKGVNNHSGYRGLKYLLVHQNEIDTLTWESIGAKTIFNGRPGAGHLGIDNEMDIVRFDNNRLSFASLIPIVKELEEQCGYVSWTAIGNPDKIIDYAPQKTYGGDATEETLEEQEEIKLAVSLSHPDNVYTWTLNGKDISEGKTYSTLMSEASAGVWRCKVTNHNLPELELFVHDMAKWLKKDGNQAAKDITFNAGSIVINHPEGLVLGEFTATDPNGDKVYFRLPDNTADNSHFRIKGNTLVSAESLFHREYIENYKIIVEAYDIYGGKYQKEFTITKGDGSVNDLPSTFKLDKNKLKENYKGIIGSFETGDGFTLSIPSALDNDKFTLQGNKLFNNVEFNYEAKKQYKVRVRTHKNGIESFKDFNIDVTDVNDAPHDISLTSNVVKINSQLGTLVGVVVGYDEDDTQFTYSLTGKEDNKLFKIEGNILKTNFVFTEPGVKTVEIEVKDDEDLNKIKSLDIEIVGEIINDNKPPKAIGLTNTTIYSTLKVGETISEILLVDPDGDNGTFTCTNDYVKIDGSQLKLKAMPTDKLTEVTIEGSDGTNKISKAFKLNKQETVAASPVTAIGIDNPLIKEDWATGKAVCNIAVSGSGTLSLAGVNADYFKIDDNKLVLTKTPDLSVFEIELTAGELTQTFYLYVPVVIDGVDYVNSEDVKVYPNPVQNVLFFQGVEDIEVQVYNTTGELVKTDRINGGKLNCEDLKAGLFIVKVGNSSMKFVKN